MLINDDITPLLLLRIMKEWECWPQAEVLLKCFQLTLGTSRKASNLSHAEIWKICRVLLSRGGISLKQAHHNSTTSAPCLSLSIDKGTEAIFMALQRFHKDLFRKGFALATEAFSELSPVPKR